MDNTLFQLKFTSKQLSRQAGKAAKEEQKEQKRVKTALLQGNSDIAQVYAQNAIRKKQEQLSLLRLASRIDAVAARVQTAVTMKQVTRNMGMVVKGMDKALQAMNIDQMTKIMDTFESQFEDLEVSTTHYENTTNIIGDQSGVDELMQKIADENGVELDHQLATTTKVPVLQQETNVDPLQDRLRALRN